MKSLIDEFINYIAIEKGHSQNTIESYRRDIEKFLKFTKTETIGEFKRTDQKVIIASLLH